MSKCFRLLLALTFCAGAIASSARDIWAQGPLAGFDEASPALGESAPNLTIFDEVGKPFQLHSFKGRHTVLVLGCLT